MLKLRGYDGGTPTHALYAALYRADRTLLAIGGDRIDLSVIPLSTDPARRGDDRPRADGDAWYDLAWTGPDARETNAALLYACTTRVACLPMPPVIDVAQRLAALPPVTLDGLTEGHITLLGGPEEAREMLHRRQVIAVKHDASTDIYDWDAYAVTVARTIRSLPVPAEARP